MPVLDLAAYKPVPATLGDANQVANGFQAIVNCINALDNNNFGAGKIFDPLKLMQDGAVDGDAMVWSTAANGGAGGWVPSTTRKMLASGLAGYPADIAQLLRGDGSWAKGGPTLISTITLGASSTITFSSIPQTFKHLLILGSATFVSGTSQPLYVNFNGDTAANYRTTLLQAIASGVTAASSNPGSAILCTQLGVGYSPFALFVTRYDAVAAHHGIVGIGAATQNGGANLGGGSWDTSAAITSILLSAATGQFAIGSSISLYGIGG